MIHGRDQPLDAYEKFLSMESGLAKALDLAKFPRAKSADQQYLVRGHPLHPKGATIMMYRSESERLSLTNCDRCYLAIGARCQLPLSAK